MSFPFDTRPDLLIVGAGPTGCVIAERAARLKKWTSLIIDKRSHIAGNCYDSKHSSGVYIHNYGPHCFRTNNLKLIEYLSSFTEWIQGTYICRSYVDGVLYPFPINRKTLEMFFNRPFSSEAEAQAFVHSQRVPIEHPKNSEEFVLSQVGEELYNSFYRGYTQKQWGLHPADLDASVCARIPIRYDMDERYVNHTYQIMPAKGFTQLFKKMIDHPRISVRTGVEFKTIKNFVIPKVATVYCGAMDDFFDYKLGRLPWRSLDFEFKDFDQEYMQTGFSINYPNDHEYTRSVEFKHLTGQKSKNTVLSYEYPKSSGDPYYPVLNEQSKKMYSQYVDLANRTAKNTFFCGRLAQFRYFNTDEVIEEALSSFQKIVVAHERLAPSQHIV